MRLLTRSKIALITVVICFSPSLFAVSYTWDFKGSGGAGTLGNSIVFNTSAPSGGPSVTATAWYIDTNGLFQKGTLGQWGAGLGVCSSGETCGTPPEHQVDNSGFKEFVLFTFSSPVDPSTVHLETTSSADLD